MSASALDSAFGPRLIESGFHRGAASDGGTIYVAEVVHDDDTEASASDGARVVLVTVTAGGFELITFVAPTDSVSYQRLLAVRDIRDDYAQVELEGSWALRRRIAAHPSDSIPRITGMVATRTIELARYADTLAAQLAASVNSELVLAR